MTNPRFLVLVGSFFELGDEGMGLVRLDIFSEEGFSVIQVKPIPVELHNERTT